MVLNDNLNIDVMCYDFPSQLLYLLQNKTLMTKENLLIDTENPCAMYEAPNNILSEALSGSAYQEIYFKMNNQYEGNLQLLIVPICL